MTGWQVEKCPILHAMIKLTVTLALMLVSLAGMSQTGTDTPKSSTDSVFTNVDSASTYPGGEKGWQMFLVRNLRFPEEAISKVRRRKPMEWKVIVRFVVTKEGKVKDVIAETNFGLGLEEEAVRLIKKSGDWLPATQNGVPVNSYKRQPVVFRAEVG